jgi:MoxR-like ATPase
MIQESRVADLVSRLRTSIGAVFLGKAEVIDLALVALIGRGHLLIDDVPGVGKTLLARAMALSISSTFRRIQFTPDLLPSDILGTSVYDQAERNFVFKPGPIFGNIILADEINRSSPRTQSALLEAMNDHSVVATQNPFEFEGTYPLPESQLDRFMLRIHVGYPPRDAEKRLLIDHRAGEPVDTLASIASAEEIAQLQRSAQTIEVDESISDYLLDIVHATRDHADIRVGASTRGALLLYRAAQSRALLQGRSYVVPDDVKSLAPAVLSHRIVPHDWITGSDKNVDAILQEVLGRVTSPG